MLLYLIFCRRERKKKKKKEICARLTPPLRIRLLLDFYSRRNLKEKRSLNDREDMWGWKARKREREINNDDYENEWIREGDIWDKKWGMPCEGGAGKPFSWLPLSLRKMGWGKGISSIFKNAMSRLITWSLVFLASPEHSLGLKNEEKIVAKKYLLG